MEAEAAMGAVLNESEIMRALASEELTITPMIDPGDQIGPTSVDLRLGFEFGVFNVAQRTHIDPLLDPVEIEQQVATYLQIVHVVPMEPFVLHPGEFVLAATLEYLKLPTNLAARLEGRSSWGRVGLQVHSTAGFVDPGFEGSLTFELQNVGKGALCLFPGLRIAQLCFFRTSGTAIPYPEKHGSKYARSLGAVGSQFFKDPEFKAIRAYEASIKKKRL